MLIAKICTFRRVVLTSMVLISEFFSLLLKYFTMERIVQNLKFIIFSRFQSEEWQKNFIVHGVGTRLQHVATMPSLYLCLLFQKRVFRLEGLPVWRHQYIRAFRSKIYLICTGILLGIFCSLCILTNLLFLGASLLIAN